ncbi:MAG TPA: hypothetical protein DDY14_11035 [Chromatiaceae bacterium]|jgi:hypothetical protein|nr:MAG: hypothetical protein N838_11175 [Thiohalocapsa sp. PB-PSB1]QQO52923.1 MAG: hypothetical protein N838_05615 [Thiohalocapsa sp. PB-PSB1]HBG95828.1 hypothetical protein [Chromatiaceae bacterium]HCS89159.1 hypothetical protein [Chromatiaceae bacterium]
MKNQPIIKFTDQPGRRERHLRRRHNNPLFAWPAKQITPKALQWAQQADQEEMESFHASFTDLVSNIAEMPKATDSETLLELKQRLEQHYEISAGLAEDHSQEQTDIRRLLDVIMRTIHRHAGDDPLASRELADEETARQIHFRLLQQPLIADLLYPESPILPDELTPTLLSSTPEEIDAVCEIFDPEHLARLVDEAETLRTRLAEAPVDISAIDRPLAQLRTNLAQLHMLGNTN